MLSHGRPCLGSPRDNEPGGGTHGRSRRTLRSATDARGLDELVRAGRAQRLGDGCELLLAEWERATIAWGERTILVPYGLDELPPLPANENRFAPEPGAGAFVVVVGLAVAGLGAAASWVHPLLGAPVNLGICAGTVWVVYRTQLSTAYYLANAGLLGVLRHPIFDDERVLTRQLAAAAYRSAGAGEATKPELDWLVTRRRDALAEFLERSLRGVAGFRLGMLATMMGLLGVTFGQGCQSVQALTGWFSASADGWAYWVRFGVAWEIETIVFDLPLLFGWHLTDATPTAPGGKLLLAAFNVAVELVVLGIGWKHLNSWRDTRALRREPPPNPDA